ncbi:hypothetical protein NB311A_13001 [Nitrobacter sp. Nb-311A]|nr:hypothetical protein NB311A_13001 [Nitrobacter sp. Nb-311A]
MEGLARDLETDGEIAESETTFLYACRQLVGALQAGVTAQIAWDRATAAAAAWLALLKAK